jgi:hypothetical protein
LKTSDESHRQTDRFDYLRRTIMLQANAQAKMDLQKGQAGEQVVLQKGSRVNLGPQLMMTPTSNNSFHAPAPISTAVQYANPATLLTSAQQRLYRTRARHMLSHTHIRREKGFEFSFLYLIASTKLHTPPRSFQPR